ncbi:lysylphosphatidylglycerol synthetase family protein, partial [Pelomonas sp. HMWF004]
MRIKAALLGFLALTVLYLGTLAWADARRQVFDGVVALASVLPALMLLSLVTYGLRFARWHWLLARAGHATPVGTGFLAYLAGFAFTATPGKVGELVRVRYLVPLGVPAAEVIAVFVFERALDLIVVLALAMLAVRDARLLGVAALFVLGCLALVVMLGRWPALLEGVARRLSAWRLPRVARIALTLSDGLSGAGAWMRPLDLTVGVALGLLAWGGTALSFGYLLHRLGVTGLASAEALAIYPQAMLAGAASMLPGGLGSTEASIAALLALAGVALPVGVLAAVGIRLATLWFAILCGLVA